MKTIKNLTLITFVLMALISCSNSESNTTASLNSKLLFTSNNNDGNVNVYNVTNLTSVATATLTTPISAADGIYYNADEDIVVQASRSTFGLEGYTGISASSSLISARITASIIGSFDMTSPRELAVFGNFYVVADNADADGDSTTNDGKLFVYEKNGSNFSLRNTLTTDIKLWGITFINNDLYAIADTTNELAVYTNFLNNTTTTTLSTSKKIAIEGIVRTHGITYDLATDTMVLTDIGDAGNTQSDGAFHVIENFSSKFSNTANNNTLAIAQQIRVSGSNTLLGNPVDVAFDGDTKTVFIAEAGNNGGRILAFSGVNSGGNLTPNYNSSLAKASAVYFYKE